MRTGVPRIIPLQVLQNRKLTLGHRNVRNPVFMRLHSLLDRLQGTMSGGNAVPSSQYSLRCISISTETDEYIDPTLHGYANITTPQTYGFAGGWTMSYGNASSAEPKYKVKNAEKCSKYAA